MSGKHVSMIEIQTNVEKALKDIVELQSRMDKLEGKEYKVDIGVDSKKLESVIKKLEKMLTSLGKGTGNFKQFENLSKELSGVVGEIQSISKAIGKIDDSGTKTLLSSIQNIDKSLTELSTHIINVNKDFGNIGKNASSNVQGINEATSATEKLTNATKELGKAQQNTKSNKSNISSGNILPSSTEFKTILSNLDLTKSKLGEIVKITKQARSDKDGKFYESYTLTDRSGSKETYGEKSKTSKGQLLDYKYVEADVKAVEKQAKIAEKAAQKKAETIKKDRELQRNEHQTNVNSALKQQVDAWKNIQSIREKIAKANPEDENYISKLQEQKKIYQEQYIEAGKVLKANQELYDVQSHQQELSKIKLKTDSSISKYNGQQESKAVEKQAKIAEAEAKKQTSQQKNKWNDFQKENAEESVRVYNELTDAIQQYSEVSKNIASGNRFEGDIEKADELENKISTLQKSPILSTAQIDESERKLEKLFDQLDNIERKTSTTKLDGVDEKISSYKTKLEKLSILPNEDHSFASWTNQLNNINSKISELENLKKNARIVDGIVNEEDLENIKKASQEIDELITKARKTPQEQRGWKDIEASKTAEKIYDILERNTHMSDEATEKIKGYYNELKSGNPSAPLDEIYNKCLRIEQAERDAGRAGKNWFDVFKEKKIYGLIGQAASMFGLYDGISMGKQVASIVTDLNTQIVDLAKVSEATSSQIYADFDSYADIAKDVGGTISDTISATADWSRNGYSIRDAKELGEVALIYKNVGDGIDIDEANESLISTLKGFQLEADQAMHIVDVFNELSNNEAITSSGIGEALQRSAASFNAANTSLEKSVSLVSATNTILQDPEKVGNMWKTVSARLRGSETELQEMGEDTEGLVKSTSKLQSLVKGITGFDIMQDENTYKDIYDIVLGIGEQWETLSDIDQAALLEALAGKNHSNSLAAALSNVDVLKKSYQEAMNAEGSALEEQSKYQESIQYSIDRTKASLEELANDTLSSDFLKGLIDAGDKLINILDFVVDKVGILKTAFVGISTFNGFKGHGLTNYVTQS